MIEQQADIWHYWDDGLWIAVTTNGTLRADGACVMGRGIAQQAAQRFPFLPFDLGRAIRASGNHVYAFPKQRIFSYPVKAHWKEPASFYLIQRSAEELAVIARAMQLPQVALVRPGCGNGGRDWAEVQPSIASILDNRFIIVEWAGN